LKLSEHIMYPVSRDSRDLRGGRRKIYGWVLILNCFGGGRP
jgi:hypothetical protein